jgi:type I restriction enzyme M protein
MVVARISWECSTLLSVKRRFRQRRVLPYRADAGYVLADRRCITRNAQHLATWLALLESGRHAQDFKVVIGGKGRKVDIAIFKPGTEHVEGSMYRAVIVEKEPKFTTKGAYKMRDPKEAAKELELLESVMASVESCNYGLWTNGLEFFFFKKEVTRFDTKFRPIGDWPMGDDSFSVEGRSAGRLRRAEVEMLRTAFRRCHNFIHGNEGMPKDAAFWQFLYLTFCKMYDEQQPNESRAFWAGAFEPFDPAGQRKIRERIEPLFAQVKRKYGELFKGNEAITRE